jgi:electron transfer flavoprotein-quinone oxidoreductase
MSDTVFAVRKRQYMEKFDAIIVGAGLAGLGCAWTLAGQGLEVLVLERGDYPGAKNLSGGRLYVNPVRDLFPGLWAQAPLERFIVHEGVTVVARERSLTLDYSGDELRAEPHQSYSVLRSRFDRWLSERLEEKGVMVLHKTRVDDVIRENGKIAGVIAGGDDLRADVVVACDGVLSLLAEKAGIHPPGKPEHYAVGIKEVIALTPDQINDRFSLDGNEGTARLYVGEVTRGLFGGGFLYTNRESISLGLVIGIHDFVSKGGAAEVPTLLDAFKSRPEIAPLIKGGSTLEYGAHMIPEGGYGGLSPLSGEGILVAGDAAGFALNMGFTVRGMEYALASGHFAAKSVLKAKEARDFSAESLSVYRRMLEESFVLKDFTSFREMPAVLSNPRFFDYYPGLVGDIMKDLYGIPAGPKARIYPTLKRHLTLREMWAMFKDLRGVTKI